MGGFSCPCVVCRIGGRFRGFRGFRGLRKSCDESGNANILNPKPETLEQVQPKKPMTEQQQMYHNEEEALAAVNKAIPTILKAGQIVHKVAFASHPVVAARLVLLLSWPRCFWHLAFSMPCRPPSSLHLAKKATDSDPCTKPITQNRWQIRRLSLKPWLQPSPSSSKS
jgi:hypothetical protein